MTQLETANGLIVDRPAQSEPGNRRSWDQLRTPQQQQMDPRTTADGVIRPRLLRVPGIADVLVMGAYRKQYQVLVDPNALLEYDVSLQQVEQAVKDNNLNASGCF